MYFIVTLISKRKVNWNVNSLWCITCLKTLVRLGFKKWKVIWSCANKKNPSDLRANCRRGGDSISITLPHAVSFLFLLIANNSKFLLAATRRICMYDWKARASPAHALFIQTLSTDSYETNDENCQEILQFAATHDWRENGNQFTGTYAGRIACVPALQAGMHTRLVTWTWICSSIFLAE